jgi:hypothetical protein
MFFAGSFDPAYAMCVFALPSQLQPTTNKRNAALIQKHMEEALGVRPGRGLLRFVPVQEEHLACGGKTMAGEIEELERGASLLDGDDGWVAVAPAGVDKEGGGVGAKGMRARKKLSVKVGMVALSGFSETDRVQQSLATLRPSATSGMPAPELTRPLSAGEVTQPPDPPASYISVTTREQKTEPVAPRKAAQRKKSFVSTIFGRSGNKSSDRSFLPAIADEG